MQIDHLPPNFLRILSGENLAKLSQSFVQQLNLGQVLKGQVVQVFSGGKAVISFQGQKATVEGQPSIQVGQSLTARVEELAPTPVLKILTRAEVKTPTESGRNTPEALSQAPKSELTIQLSSRKNTPISFLTKPELEFLTLSPGKEYSAQIKQIVNSTTVNAQLGARDIQVKVQGPLPLTPGDLIPVSLEKVSRGLFQFIQANGPVIKKVDPGLIKSYLPVREPFGEMIPRLSNLIKDNPQISGFARLGNEGIESLKQTLQLLAPRTGEIPDAQTLKEQVGVSGLNYESKVLKLAQESGPSEARLNLARDLKGQLLNLIQEVEKQAAHKETATQTRGPMREMLQALRQAVDNIEFHQLAHQLAKQENHSLLLQIPNPFSQGDPTLKLYVRPQQEGEHGKKGKQKSGFNLVFLLNLTALGNLKVDSHLSETQLKVKIHVESQAVGDFIFSRKEELQAPLAGLGFQADLTCCVDERVELNLEAELPPILAGDSSRLVDVTT